MRISGNVNTTDVAATSKIAASSEAVTRVVKQGSDTTKVAKQANVESMIAPLDNSEETKEKVQEAVKTMNEVLEANNSTSKFEYHEGLDRYYVSVVDRETEEVVKEIPPRKLLDAFYEMQKMIGMIVDEKI